MKRREFIALIGGATAWPFSARAQPQPERTTKLVRIGMLANSLLPPLRKMSQKLKELGYVEGETVRFEYRFAEGHDDRYSILAAELVALPVDLIVTLGTPAALAAKLATRTIPIVMGIGGRGRQHRHRRKPRAPRWKYHRLFRIKYRIGKQAAGSTQRAHSASRASGNDRKCSQPFT